MSKLCFLAKNALNTSSLPLNPFRMLPEPSKGLLSLTHSFSRMLGVPSRMYSDMPGRRVQVPRINFVDHSQPDLATSPVPQQGPRLSSLQQDIRRLLTVEEEFASRNTSVVHMLTSHRKTFITVTDSKGNKKTGASAGSLEESKGRGRAARYAGEATAEHVGRAVRQMGIKSVVIKVKGFMFFKKKRKLITSFRDGVVGEGGYKSPIIAIRDVTQLPHNGCRLPKRRRV